MALDGKKLFLEPPSTGILGFNTSQKCTLINAFWPYLNLAEVDYSEKQYETLLRSWEEILKGLYPDKHKFATEEWNGMLEIIMRLTSGRDSTSELIDNVRTNFLNTGDDAIACSIDLAVRLWTGVNVHSGGLRGLQSQESCVEWPQHRGLSDVIARPFGMRAGKAQSAQYSSFDDSFTATGLRDGCWLKIVWTDSLLDHLRLLGSKGKRQLLIYKHRISLVNHREGPNPIFDPELIDETIRTLDLLFPKHNRRVSDFLVEENVQMWIEDPLETPRATQLDEFFYWNGRLAQLLKLLYGPPEHRLLSMLDTRDPLQFATLWLAVLGVTFMTLLFGVLSTVYSSRQYYVAVDSYKLALAQACQQTSPPLPEYCT